MYEHVLVYMMGHDKSCTVLPWDLVLWPEKPSIQTHERNITSTLFKPYTKYFKCALKQPELDTLSHNVFV